MEKKLFENLHKAILEYDDNAALSTAKEIIEGNFSTLKAIEVMTTAIREVGTRYGNGELWLPDLVGAGQAMSKAMPLFDKVLSKTGEKRESKGIVVIGTVYGDIHSIGKDMVATLLKAEGFEVHDLGASVEPQVFIDEVKSKNADILAMSALLTVTAPEQNKTIELLKKEKIRDKVKVIVGGAPITQKFANDIGADGFETTAPRAVELVKNLLSV